jgi:hypothetical protein
VPDVAGNADPDTGYQVLVNGQTRVYGGTSAVAPLWAALIVRLAEAADQRFGLLHPRLYAGVTPGATGPGFNDITSGSNGAYSAGPGWDPCTGLGSPDGEGLLTSLTPQAPDLSRKAGQPRPTTDSSHLRGAGQYECAQVRRSWLTLSSGCVYILILAFKI